MPSMMTPYPHIQYLSVSQDTTHSCFAFPEGFSSSCPFQSLVSYSYHLSQEELGWEEATLPIILAPVQLLDYLG